MMYIKIKNTWTEKRGRFFSQQIQEILVILSQSQALQDPPQPLYNHPVLVILCYPPDQGDPTERPGC